MISYASDIAANSAGSNNGPQTIRQAPILKDWPLSWSAPVHTTAMVRQWHALPIITQLVAAIADQVEACQQHKQPWCVLGGDHSCAIGTWSGVSRAIKQPLGLIWMDAHLDAHTPSTSHTMNIHGMPLATLLGHGDSSLTGIAPSPPLLAEHVVIIGARSYEEEEYQLLQQLGVTLYGMYDIQKQGLEQIMQQAVAQVSHNTAGFGLSFDVDVIDPKQAPGVSTAVPDGINTSSLWPVLSKQLRHPKLLGCELVEFNPANDRNNQTLQIIIKLLQTLYPQYCPS